MKRFAAILPVAILGGAIAGGLAVHLWTHQSRFVHLENDPWTADKTDSYAGTESCRECHETFYQLWAPSHHGKAMQPATRELFRQDMTPLESPIRVGADAWSVDGETLEMIQHTPEGERRYLMEHAMGGKNIYFFLTPLDRGRLQVLPLSYDVRRKEWFNTTQAMIRHFADEEPADTAIDWRDPLLTFNTACYHCHVSQLDKNYDPETDTYHTTWREPGINCEACHGPGDAHARLCRAVPKGTVPKRMRLVSWSDFTVDQINDSCAPCHAKGRAIKPDFGPGDRFFDYYHLTCLEDRDFYPDGRDLGENYTQTGWLMNPCAQAGLLDCMHCHTSSGRYRYKDKNPNGACLPCHAQRVRHAATHTHHQAGAGSPACVDCHMPMTEFGRMLRSDHSMRPPSPGASATFGSPDACILCHDDHAPAWAAQHVATWHPDARWQPRILHEGKLIEAARQGDWTRLPAMLAYLTDDHSDPVVITSLLRLLDNCGDERKWGPIRRVATHPHPLPRSAAVYALRTDTDTPASRSLMLEALHDDMRLVRVQAAAALTRLHRGSVPARHRVPLQQATDELLASFDIMPDDWSSHYNLGNYHSDRGDLDSALASYRRSIELRDDVVMPYVNASVIASQQGDMQESTRLLRAAHAVDPAHGAVNLNLGLALAEQHDMVGAATHLRLALQDDAARGQAAYNLAVLTGERDPDEAIRLCAIAAAADPDNPRNAYTHAYYLAAHERPDEAITVLEKLIEDHHTFGDAWILLARLYMRSGDPMKARAHVQRMLHAPFLPAAVRHSIQRELEAYD